VFYGKHFLSIAYSLFTLGALRYYHGHVDLIPDNKVIILLMQQIESANLKYLKQQKSQTI